MDEGQVERVREPAAHEFDKAYWEKHWTSGTDREPGRGRGRGSGRAPGRAPGHRLPVNPYLVAETRHLPVGTALDAGCGTGAEAVWLAQHGWQVTGADISATALAAAAGHAQTAGLTSEPQWVEADLTRWEPRRSWDLVVTSYAHPTIGQLAFYRRIADWVAPGGSVLIIGHLHTPDLSEHRTSAPGHHTPGPSHHTPGPGHHTPSPSHHTPGPGHHPQAATVTHAGITELFTGPGWRVDASYENTRTLDAGTRTVQLHDVVVRAHRRLSAGQ